RSFFTDQEVRLVTERRLKYIRTAKYYTLIPPDLKKKDDLLYYKAAGSFRGTLNTYSEVIDTITSFFVRYYIYFAFFGKPIRHGLVPDRDYPIGDASAKAESLGTRAYFTLGD
ncbi:hypothetical protein N7539_003142, partial [Penicillium diatomitis]